MIRLGPKTSECEKNVIFVSTATSCDVTNCATTLHGFNKHFLSSWTFFLSFIDVFLFSVVHRCVLCTFFCVLVFK